MKAEAKTDVQELRQTIEHAQHEYLRLHKAKYRLPREFVDGIVRGLGIAVGGTVVFSIIILLLSHLAWPSWKTWLENNIVTPAEIQATFQNAG